MATPKRTSSGASYASLEQRARMDFAASVLADPLSSADHVSEARKVLTSATAGAPALDLGEWIKGLPPMLLFDFRSVIQRIVAHKDATPDTAE